MSEKIKSYEFYKKASKIINSCENKKQLLNAKKIIRLFFNKTEDGNFQAYRHQDTASFS